MNEVKIPNLKYDLTHLKINKFGPFTGQIEQYD